jgi:5-oxopent-3-ene-1,2,5-tricarboxylate decarboxylase/2-hydroxyhepta-2,4-diene-1,7-dioate isomerase
VLAPLLNDRAAWSALGDAVHAPPYKGPPRAPVLYIKPRNTLAAHEAVVPDAPDEFEIGASLAMVIARCACRVPEDEALGCVAGWTLVADLSVPHGSYYRPAARSKARDGSCLIGPRVVPRDTLQDPSAAVLEVSVDGRPVHTARTAGMVRPAARLIADVTEFMTLHAGDLLLLGVAAGAPRVRAGQSFAVACGGIGRLEGSIAPAERTAP